ncbi:MAG: ATP-binding cassette domain-containing protein, partial [Clostridia bacterium]|nr:ATP-binding cassette domain-containing protein [Clostridia bacterium]
MPEIRNLSVEYGERKIFDKFNLSVESGKVLCIMGKSGCGKTTLLNCIASLIAYGGEITQAGKISYVFQECRLLPNKSVLRNVTYVLGKDKSALESIAADALKRMDIYDIKDKYPANISGGEASRVALARAFAVGADTLLMDEPFRALDIGTKRGIISNFISGKPDKCSVIFV